MGTEFTDVTESVRALNADARYYRNNGIRIIESSYIEHGKAYLVNSSDSPLGEQMLFVTPWNDLVWDIGWVVANERDAALQYLHGLVHETVKELFPRSITNFYSK